MNVRQPTANSHNRRQKTSRLSANFGATSAQVRLAGILILLVLPALACGYINPVYQANNQVRLAVYQYERAVRGKADDLVLDFDRREPRLVFAGQNEAGGRTVWLYRLGASEFFALRPPEKTYLYIQAIAYNNNYTSATVTIFRGDGSGFQEWELTVAKDNEQWRVIQDKETQPPNSD